MIVAKISLAYEDELATSVLNTHRIGWWLRKNTTRFKAPNKQEMWHSKIRSQSIGPTLE